ncbi:hypothetical protein ACMD2_01244 [Ananas comosus]|uniref:Uncharacterized protein n=1 Tax=Ananas comosus TaxID=4615 RepID=A0A199VAA9_ANACO|nr:hypothetical protein ACMD2_01244 [Ananas comosus]
MATPNSNPYSSSFYYENHYILKEEKEEEEEDEEMGRGRREAWPRRGGAVRLEGYVEGSEGEDGGSDGGGGSGSGMAPRRSLTGEDLEELKGCFDLGFGFSYDEIPELCGTLPALELCYSMSQRFLDDQHQHQKHPNEPGEVAALAGSVHVPNWRIAGAGDDPEEVKARLKYWAQAVACTVKLCN